MNNIASNTNISGNEIFIAYAEKIKSFGYHVLYHIAEKDLKTNYGYFSDGKHIGEFIYNSSANTLELSTVHKLGTNCGNGFQLVDDFVLTENNEEEFKILLKECFEIMPKDFEEFIKIYPFKDIIPFENFDAFKKHLGNRIHYLKIL